MAAPRRERDDRRSVGSHEKMMSALGRAAGGWKNDGIAYKPGNYDDMFSPGHGHVSTGRIDYYDRDKLASPKETYAPVDANKGIKDHSVKDNSDPEVVEK